MQFKDYWNVTHKKFASSKVIYDNWLDEFEDILKNCKTKVLDLGCGNGNDTLYLLEKGFDVLSCDYSEVALENVKANIKNAQTKLMDISNPFPFQDNSFDLIVADLCLHYFYDQTTKKILNEIKRILSPNGYLIARVNSTHDINHGAGKGEKLEENFYFVEGYNKRFFNIQDAQKYFSIIGTPKIKQDVMLRYSKPKKVIVVCVKKD